MKNFSITKNGKPLDKSLYIRDEKTKTLSTNEYWLVLDFSDYSYCTFKTGSYCTFKTGSRCTFDTGSGCTFNTGSRCTFDTGSCCTFDTGSDCTFDTSSDCTFDTSSDCIFDTGYGCTFNAGSRCVVVRRDVYEVIELKEWQKIKLNWYWERWYKIIEDEQEIQEMTLSDVCKELGRNIKIIKE